MGLQGKHSLATAMSPVPGISERLSAAAPSCYGDIVD
jgi:hypothetical protein